MQSLRDFGDLRPLDAARQPSRARKPLPSRNRPPHASWLNFTLRGALIAGLAAGCAISLKFGLPVAAAARSADALAVKVGLGINQIAVTGSRNTLSDDIFAALKLEHDGSLLAYDTAAARSRLEALAWVESAQVSRTLPDGLDVAIRERQPFAVWQHRQLMFLIDAQGRTLEPASRTDHPELPFVVGEEADAGAHALFDMLKSHPALRDRLDAAIRVGGRRWDLQLRNAPTLMLPEDKPEEALAWVEKMDKDERLLDRRVDQIDLRVPGRAAFHLTPARPGALNRGA